MFNQALKMTVFVHTTDIYIYIYIYIDIHINDYEEHSQGGQKRLK